jgi:hypothetical protein
LKLTDSEEQTLLNALYSAENSCLVIAARSDITATEAEAFRQSARSYNKLRVRIENA